MKFNELTAPELRAIDHESVLVLAPIASCEQHSRHLATFTDSVLVGAVAEGVERNLPESVVLLPVLWFGASDHHLPFGATLTASVDTHVQILVELLQPLLDDGYRRILVLNGHGGNIDTLHVALRRLQPRYKQALLTGASYWEIAQDDIARICEGPRKHMGHACEIETSMMMHLRPDLVRTGQIEDDPDRLPSALSGLFVAHDMRQRTDHGCVGYPEKATAEKGRRFLDAIVSRVTRAARAILDHPF